MPDTPDTPNVPEIPADLTALSREQLVDLEGSLLARFEALREDTSADAVAELGRIAQTLPQVGDQVDALDAQTRQATEAADAIGRYQSRATPPESPPAADTTVEPGADTVDSGADPVAPGVDTGADIAPVGELVPVAASSTPARRTVADIAARAPRPAPPARRRTSNWVTSLTAGAEIPNMAASSAFQSGKQLSEAILNRTQALTKSNSESASALIAQAHLPQLGEAIGANESASFITFKMLEAVDRWRSEQERRAVTADTGWCAPTETVWDLCDPYVADGMVSLPEIPITRGGLKFFPMPDLACFANYGWEFDSDELECMNKPCQEIPCPEPVEVEPGVIGACIEAGILQARQFPELVERYVRGVLVAHQMRISKKTLELMCAGSDQVVYDDALVGGSGFTAALFNAIEAQAEDLREDYLLAESETIVVNLPRWVRGAIRADLANRMGVDFLSISNQRINEMFAALGVMVSWIKGWQNECIGAPGAQRAYPTTVRFLIYREGAWVRGLEPIIELESQYDSVLLRQNKFTRLFTEQALMLANLCTRSRCVTVPVCPNGATNNGNPIDCFSEACTPGTITCPANVECPPEPCCEDVPPAPGITAQ